MASHPDRLQSLLGLARSLRPDVSSLEPGFETRVLGRIQDFAPRPVSFWETLTAHNPVPVFAAVCLLVTAWALMPGLDTQIDLARGALQIFDVETLSLILPGNLL